MYLVGLAGLNDFSYLHTNCLSCPSTWAVINIHTSELPEEWENVGNP